MPILIGSGQSMSQWNSLPGQGVAPSPLGLATHASKNALESAGISGRGHMIDTVAVVRAMADSFKRGYHPHNQNANFPGTLAREIDATPQSLVYTEIGGQVPQSLVNEIAARIHAGEAELVLIAGAEANRASKAAQKQGLELDWTDGDDAPFEDRGFGGALLCRREIKHSLVIPAYMYALFETAQAAAKKHSRSAHREAMSHLFSRFADVAANNPYAQFPEPKDTAFLTAPSKQNYKIADPFLKWHVAQDAVNQGAAILLASERKADELGIPTEQRIYLHGSGEATDTLISERDDMSVSWAMDTALNRALDMVGKTPTDIDLFDLYSCFPCAVTAAAEALGLNPFTEERPLTVTGGLPFFGGPGNNYSLHAISSMTEKLRTSPDAFGLVLANGGWMTKEAAGIYSARRPDEFIPVEAAALAVSDIEIDPEPTGGILETYTVIHDRNGPASAIAFGRTESDARFIAKAAPEALVRLREDASQVGARILTETEAEITTFRFT